MQFGRRKLSSLLLSDSKVLGRQLGRKDATNSTSFVQVLLSTCTRHRPSSENGLFSLLGRCFVLFRLKRRQLLYSFLPIERHFE